MKDAILVINAGSSSIKFSVFLSQDEELNLDLKGQIDGIGVLPKFVAEDKTGKILVQKAWENSQQINHPFLLKYLLDWLNANLKGGAIKVAGHRVVHGGTTYSAPVVVTESVLDDLEKLIPLAPLHQPHNLSPIHALRDVYPDLVQVACFDTSFHTSNPSVFQYFFIPRHLSSEGVKRYGFHGLSYEYIIKKLKKISPEVAQKKVIVAHLGSGSSMCALEDGKSTTTSMGFTALDGLPMGSRPGNLDVGVVFYLMREKKMRPEEIENLLYRKSGLLGLSEISNDMRVLEQSADPRAVETIDALAWRICQMIGSLAASIQGIDALVFTAGIGENSSHLRKMVCDRLKWLGVEVDDTANKNSRVKISSDTSRVSVWVIPTNEEIIIAEHSVKLTKSSPALN
jgi:acetate kinase